MKPVDDEIEENRAQQYAFLIATIVVACLVSACFSIWTDILDIRKEFREDTILVHQDLKQHISSIEPVISSLIGFHHANDELNNAEYTSFVQQILAAYPFIAGMAKMEHVRSDELDDLIRRIKDDGIVTFTLKEFDSGANSESAWDDHHLVISFIEPFNPITASALGTDLATHDDFIKAVFNSVEGVVPVATQPISFPSIKQKVILVLKPVYYGRYLPGNASERKRLMSGVVALIIKPEDFLKDILNDENHVDISLFKLGGQVLVDQDGEIKVFEHVEVDDEHEHGTLYTFKTVKSIQKFGQSFEFTLQSNIGYEVINIWKLLTVVMITAVIIVLSAGLYRTRKNSAIREKQAADAIFKEGERFTQIIDTAFDAIITTDNQGKIQSWNQNAENIFGYKKDKVKGQLIWPLILSSDSFREHNQYFSDYFEITLECPNHQIELNGVDEHGQEFPIELSSSSSIIDYDPVFSFFVRDISKRKKNEKRIHQLAFFDPLTNLPNRLSFKMRTEEAINAAIESNTTGALLYIDLDNFKRINDSLGHVIGDKLIKKIGKRILHHAKGNRSFNGDTGITVLKQNISRISGDEFTILLTEIASPDELETFVRSVQNNIGRLIKFDVHEVYITPSIGIALYPNDGHDVDELLKHADIAKHHAKAVGKNNFQFYAAKMNERATEFLKLEGKLRRALDNDEMQLYYQPQIESSSGEIVAAEALIRWIQPELGMISPMDFIPLAEDTGMILDIGDWVIREACRQNKQWQDAGYDPIRVAVNLSGLQFIQKDLAKQVQQILNESGLDARFLELEITESLIMRDVGETINTLNSLRDMNLGISVDDFGTGYSSLSYLKRFPLESLKIDRSFVKDIPNDIEDVKITSTIIAMAKSLNLEVVAEGVETAEQYSFLKAKGCELLQGYLFSKPVQADEFEQFLINRKTWEI